MWAAGEDLAAKFVTHANMIKGIAMPHHEKQVVESAKRAEEIMQKLSGLMLEEPQPIKITEFYTQLSKQAAHEMKELRLKLKDESAVQLGPKIKGTAEEVLQRSRNQLLKWGLAKFLTFESIRLTTSAGKQLRNSLKVLWDRNISDEEFMKYLGTDVDEMEGIFAIDSAIPMMPKEQVSGKRVASASSATPAGKAAPTKRAKK